MAILGDHLVRRKKRRRSKVTLLVFPSEDSKFLYFLSLSLSRGEFVDQVGRDDEGTGLILYFWACGSPPQQHDCRI